MSILYKLEPWANATLSVILLLLLLLTLASVETVRGYNLDLQAPIIRRGMNGTYFGFSVAMHREGEENMFLVGAPLGDSNVTNITRGGAVYRCPVLPYDNVNGCTIVPIEEPPKGRSRWNYRTNQWLGAVVRSSGGSNGRVISCAPFRVQDIRDSGLRETTTGVCFISSRNFTSKTPVNPCHAKKKKLRDDADKEFCHAGMSADIFEDGHVVGAPNAPVRQTGGSAVRQAGLVYAEIDDVVYPERKHDNTFGLHLTSYNGFSVAYGKFRDNNEMNFVTGAPRAKRLLGSVLILQTRDRPYKSMLKIRRLNGQQMGSHFGHSVAVSDLNNDGLDDIIVGAPSYWNRETQQVSVGQVHIYYQNEQRELPGDSDSKSVITGHVTGGKFGHVVTPLGDINSDGYNDLAVGAPFDGDGAVYIFSATRREDQASKIVTRASQVLRPSDFSPPLAMNHFGYALSGNRDADSNSLPDLLVGDYSTDSIVLIRARPVIRPELSITFSSRSVNISREDSEPSSFTFEICLLFSGLGADDLYSFRIVMKIDARKSNSRAKLFDRSGPRIHEYHLYDIPKNISVCDTWDAILKDGSRIEDRSSPISVRASVFLNKSVVEPGQLQPYFEPPNQYWQNNIPLFYTCLNNHTCTPDLSLMANSDRSLLYMGDSGNVTINVTVENKGEDAFDAMLYASFPKEFKFITFRPIESAVTIQCKVTKSTEVTCNLGEQLPSETILSFSMRFHVPSVPGNTEIALINLHTSSSIESENLEGDNNVTIPIELQPMIAVEMGGFPVQKSIVFNDRPRRTMNSTHENDVGDEIIHSYWVRNLGPSVIERAVLEVDWPMKTLDGRYLLYLTEVKATDGEDITPMCDVIGGKVNPESLQLNNNGYELAEAYYSRLDETDTRVRRAAVGALDHPTATAPQDSGVLVADCKDHSAECVKIRCNISDFRNDVKNILLTVRSRIWLNTVQHEDSRQWTIISRASFRVTSVPYVVQPVELLEEHEKLTVYVTPVTVKLLNKVPLWSIILAVGLGHVFIFLIALALWKVGFFKRKRVKLLAAVTVTPQETGSNGDTTNGVRRNSRIIDIQHRSHEFSVTNGNEPHYRPVSRFYDINGVSSQQF